MLRRAKATACAICWFSGPVISCASIWPDARSFPRYRVAVIAAFGSHRRGSGAHSKTPATVARGMPASSFARSANLPSATSGSAAPSALSSGFQSDSSRVLNPVSRNRLFVEGSVAGLGATLRQAQPFVAGHPSLGAADADVPMAGTLMRGIARRYIHNQQSPAIREFHVLGANANRRLDGVGADLDDVVVQRAEALKRHVLHCAFIGDTAKQGAAVSVGECHDLVRQVGALRANRSVASELDLLEFPGAVLAQFQLAGDLFSCCGSCADCRLPRRHPIRRVPASRRDGGGVGCFAYRLGVVGRLG